MSLLPLGVVYLVSHFFFFLLYYVFPYRKNVVKKNIRNSFPGMPVEAQKKQIKKFYHYLTFLVAESIKNLSFSKNKLLQHISVENGEVMEDLFKQKKDVILLSSHYNNWELLITAQNLLFKHQAVGIGMPLSNKFWDQKINDRRERFGMKVVHANNYKQVLNEMKDIPTATLVLGDQSPGKAENCFWTTFLHQPTAFFFGAEIMANQMDTAVVYVSIQQIKRGRYKLVLKPITEEPKSEEYGYVTEKYIRFLEEDIVENPTFWLWSHKRWKKEVPGNLEEIKVNHRDRFNKRFRATEVEV
jgi:KDO2-lipid IV(A) lauroyltransferase